MTRLRACGWIGGLLLANALAPAAAQTATPTQPLTRSGREIYAEFRDSVTFKDAPGDRGTEIHVEIDEEARPGKLGEAVQKLKGDEPLAKVKDTLRRFKARLETGEVPRSEAVPEGELAERKLKQRPAQPLEPSEREKAGV